MKAAAVLYTLFAAVLAFAVGSIQSCVDRVRIKAATPDEVVIPAREFKVDALPFPSEYDQPLPETDVWVINVEQSRETVEL